MIENIDNLKTSLEGVVAEMSKAKDEANGWRTAMQGIGTATREQQQSVSADAAAVDALNKKVKQLADEEARLNAAVKKAQDEYNKLTENKLRYKKLTMEEVAEVEKLRQSLKGQAQDQINAVKNIDIQTKSYNELYQTYNALKESLNQMTVAERENSEAGKVMVNRAKEIRDTLNNLQQQTGNYTLNVGNYMSAMAGLQMQTQQILREIPSAQNLSQFFLAISNNIPMFTDAMARYNKTLPEIKAKLAAVTAEIARQEELMAGLNVESTEYAAKQAQINELKRQENQLQSASVSGWKAVLKSVGSWQTLLIAGLLILRKIPEWIKKARDKAAALAKEWKNIEVTEKAALTQLQIAVTDAMSETENELSLILSKMQTVTQGSEEWQTSVQRINELTKGTLDTINATPEEIRKVTQAYLEQEKQLATNRSIISQLSSFDVADVRKRQIRSGEYNAEEIAMLAGKTGDDKFIERAQAYLDARKNFQSKRYKELEKARNRAAYGSRERSKIQKEMNELAAGYTSFDRELDQLFVSGSEKARRALMANYVPLATGEGGGNKKPKAEKDQVADLLTLERALIDERIANIENEYERLESAEKERYKRFLEDREAELKLLSEDDPRRAVINQRIEEEEDTHIRKMFEIDEKRRQELIKLSEEEEKLREQNAKDGAKAELKAAVDGWAQYKAKMVEEGKTRKQIVEAEVAAEIARLNLMLKLNRDVNGEIMSDEQKAKVQEWINLLEKLQQTGNYGDYKPGQFMGKGGANVTNERKNYANIWEVLGIDMDNNQVSALNSVFDQAKAALNSWMDARKAAADQAKELADDEVSAAENALNREIELRNQGYANDVALKERELADAKERQKKAAELQKKAEKDALAVNTAMEASSMAVAIANLFKDFPLYAAIPLTAVLLGSFAAAKVQSFQAINSTKYREGGYMLLEGGSHQSGHDVNLGIGPDGSNLRAEGGEYFAVINKRNSRKYSGEIPGIVNALNSGMFEDKYIKTSDAVGLLPRIIRADDGTAVDLSAVESGVGELVKQGERTWSTEGEYRVMRYKNLTRRVKLG